MITMGMSFRWRPHSGPWADTSKAVPVEEQCWHHGREPVPDGAYLVCGECGHCYVTADDLRREYRLMDERCMASPWYDATSELWAVDPLVVPTADEIYACPLCAHDF